MVTLITTLNLLVSLFAVLTVAGAILTTLAGLVILDWSLDVLESVVVTVAVGLAVDLTLHLAVAFRSKFYRLLYLNSLLLITIRIFCCFKQRRETFI